jgi:ectoine hydroxylase-related dioxygenase (phytanoyl-CoA dioxygenase family)
MAICAHPSIVIPVAQLLGTRQAAFFQSRFRVKYPQVEDSVPWHQDIGKNSGGYRADGNPVPSVTAWLSIDGATAESGSLSMIPGTHTRLFGNWRAGFSSKLEDDGAISDDEVARAVPAATKPGEFYLLHSWTLHKSFTNTTTSPRSAIVLRFVAPDDAVLPNTEYTLLDAVASE